MMVSRPDIRLSRRIKVVTSKPNSKADLILENFLTTNQRLLSDG